MTETAISIPGWLKQWGTGLRPRYADDRQAMSAAIELSRLSFLNDTGGPFGAVVVDAADGSLVAAGANCVTSLGLSTAHAEVVALSRAQQLLQHWDLSGAGSYVLYTSCEPCVMCFGAVLWSGVRRLVCAGSKDDAEAVGFDEGPRPRDWIAALEERGIEVETGLMRDEAAAALQEYAARGGTIYNPGN